MFVKGHKGYVRKQSTVLAEEEKFLLAYYSDDSEIKGNGYRCAIHAGYSESTAEKASDKIIGKYDKKKFREAMKAVGITNVMMAVRLKDMIKTGANKDAINAIRLALASKGESTDQQQVPGQVFNAPVMIIQGMTNSRMKALREAIPQLTAEQQQLEEERESAQRLADYKAGKLGHIIRGELIETPVQNLDAHHDQPPVEAHDKNR